MAEFLPPIEKLIEQFRKLPGVGRKSAIRMAFSILDLSEEAVERFSQMLIDAKTQVHNCKFCFNLAIDDVCGICSDISRNHNLICVVEDAKAIMAFEKVRGFKGVYHVLGGVISPINGITPDKLHIAELVARVKDGAEEVIIATNPTVEGETTATYIAKLLANTDVKVTRLAYGIPVGGDIEYADEVTLNRAIEGRRKID